MHVLMLAVHPDRTSLTYSLATEFERGLKAAGHTVHALDLEADHFSPVVSLAEHVMWRERQVPADVARYQEWVRAAQGLAFIYPIWWATPPALLQGWLQRVFTQGFAFDYIDGRPRGLLNAKAQLIVNVGSRDVRLESSYVEPLVGVLRYCGIGEINRLINWGIHPAAARVAIDTALQAAYAAGLGF